MQDLEERLGRTARELVQPFVAAIRLGAPPIDGRLDGGQGVLPRILDRVMPACGSGADELDALTGDGDGAWLHATSQAVGDGAGKHLTDI